MGSLLKIKKAKVELLVFILLLLSLFLESFLGDALGVGKAAFLLVYLSPLLVIDFKQNRIDRVELFLLLFIILYTFSSVIDGGGYKYAFYIVLVGLFYRFGRGVNIPIGELGYVVVFCFVFSAFCVLGYSNVDFGVPKNTVGASILYFFIISIWVKYLRASSYRGLLVTSLLGFFILYSLDVRGASAQLLMLVSALYLSTLPFFNRISSRTFFIGFLIVLIVALVIVAFGDELEFFYVLEEGVNSVSGRSIKSGRQLIWPVSLELISENPMWGLGAGFLINSLAGSETWSAHNTFLQVGMQVGGVGIFLVLIMLYLVLNKISVVYEKNNDRFFMMSIWFVIAFFNIFEVSLFQNSMPISVIQWFILGLIVNPNYSKHLMREGKL